VRRSATGIVCSLLLLLYPTVDSAQTDLTNTLSRCRTVSADSARLACYDSLKLSAQPPAPLSTPLLSGGGWQVSDEKNPLDDTRTVTLMLVATSGQSTYGHPILLVLRCKSHQTEVFIGWGTHLGDHAEVTVQVGSAKARTSAWGVSTDHTATFYHEDPVAFIKELVGAERSQGSPAGRFVAQVTPDDESPITAIFDVKGLEFAVKPLREACGW
jgi:type VI secretion system protein VasI